MNQTIARTGNGPPIDFGMPRFDLIWHVARCFAHDLQQSYQSQAQDLIIVEIFPPFPAGEFTALRAASSISFMRRRSRFVKESYCIPSDILTNVRTEKTPGV